MIATGLGLIFLALLVPFAWGATHGRVDMPQTLYRVCGLCVLLGLLVLYVALVIWAWGALP